MQMPQASLRMMSADTIKGLYTDLSPAARQFSYLSSMRNLWRDGKTAAQTRPGRTVIGSVLGSPTGLAPLYKEDGTEYLIAGAGSNLYQSTGGAWTSIYAGMGSNLWGSAVFNDELIVCDPTNKPVRCFGTGALPLEGNPPQARYACSAYKSLFLAGVPGEQHMLYASHPGDAKRWPATVDVNLIPNAGDSTAIPVNDKDGDRITWLQVFRSNLVIWKRHSIHELYGPEVGQVSDNWRVMQAGNRGTPTGRTVVEINSSLYWLSDDGIVQWGGGKIELISDPIRQIINRINWGSVGFIAAGHSGRGHYILSLPLDGAGLPNTTVVYDTNDGTWWVWDGWSPCAFAPFRIAGQEILCHTDGWGGVYQMTGTTDNGTAIPYEAIFGPSTGGINFREKIMRRAFFAVSVNSGASLQASVAVSDTGAFGTAITLGSSAATTRIKRSVPLTNGADEIDVYAPRIKLAGTGIVTIHDAGIEWAERET